MQISYSQLQKYLPTLKEKLINKRINKLICFSKDVFMFSITKESYFVISLKNGNSFVAIWDNELNLSSVNNSDIQQLKKELSGFLIQYVELKENDRILTFHIKGLNEVYKEVAKKLIIELVPNKANLVIADQEERILFKYRDLSGNRISLKNALYQYPEAPSNPIPYKDCSIDFSNDFERLLDTRKKEIYKPIFDYINKRLKICKSKNENLIKDLQKAKEHENDGELGNLILMNLGSITPKSKSVLIDNIEIQLDPRLKPFENANRYFKLSKKSKETIRLSEQNISRTNLEVSTLENLLNGLTNSDLETCSLLINEFGLDKLLNKEVKQEVQSSNFPYYFKIQNTTIMFGKSAKQNDYLSFFLTTCKDHLWMHIIGCPGSHLVIKDENPSKDIIKICAELLCHASKKVDGTVMLTKKANIRKGKNIGEVLVNTYDQIRVNSVSKEAINYYETATKINKI